MIYTGKTDIYFLPQGGERGYDEIPLHSDFTRLLVTEHLDGVYIDGSINDPYATDEFIPTIRSWELHLTSLGQVRDIPKSIVHAGSKGVLTFLYGKRPEAQHMEILFDKFTFDFPSYSDVRYNYHALGMGQLMSGLYTCNKRAGRVQIDRADGTFIEHQLYYEVPLDDMINNRYHGWT